MYNVRVEAHDVNGDFTNAAIQFDVTVIDPCESDTLSFTPASFPSPAKTVTMGESMRHYFFEDTDVTNTYTGSIACGHITFEIKLEGVLLTPTTPTISRASINHSSLDI